ncbi:hypothetical protein MKW98_003722 [Papaver atlanticum]|uniref:Uncharacterized protein n=1 Tax=Papaver atlanticum TaxID=357466 RepID=A0AAD4XEW4_9MAGN|nr:hypothetical protein MKW98_003722 [Papaver atlanticum]
MGAVLGKINTSTWTYVKTVRGACFYGPTSVKSALKNCFHNFLEKNLIFIVSIDIDPSSTTSCTVIGAISGGDEDPRRRFHQEEAEFNNNFIGSPCDVFAGKDGFKGDWKQSAEDISGPRQSPHSTRSIKVQQEAF